MIGFCCTFVSRCTARRQQLKRFLGRFPLLSQPVCRLPAHEENLRLRLGTLQVRSGLYRSHQHRFVSVCGLLQLEALHHAGMQLRAQPLLPAPWCTEPSVLSLQGDASPAHRGPGHLLHHILQQQPPGTCRCCHQSHAAAQEAANLSAQHTDVWVSRSHPHTASCPSCLGEGGSFTIFLEG